MSLEFKTCLYKLYEPLPKGFYCRVCLSTSKSNEYKQLLSRFNSDQTIAEIIENFARIQILQNHDCAELICCYCLKRLRAAVELQSEIIESDNKLRYKLINPIEYFKNNNIDDQQLDESEIISEEANLIEAPIEKELVPLSNNNDESIIVENNNNNIIGPIQFPQINEINDNKLATNCVQNKIEESDLNAKIKKETLSIFSRLNNDFLTENNGKFMLVYYTQFPENNPNGNESITENISPEENRIEESTVIAENTVGQTVDEVKKPIKKKRKRKYIRKREGPIYPVKCPECSSTLADYKSAKAHCRIHKSLCRFRCSICLKGFWSKGNMNQHMFIHSGESPYRCEHCGKMCKTRMRLRSHQLVHKEATLKCDQCDKTFKISTALKYHKLTHTEEFRYQCDKCDRKYQTPDQLKAHRRTKHTPNWKEICHICGKAVRHIKHHLLEHKRSFKCDICLRSFPQPQYLKRHKAIHSDEKPFSCPVCQKSFKSYGSLWSHKRGHESEKHFPCELCGKTFHFNCQLQKHKDMHMGIKATKQSSEMRKYQCDQCDKQYTCSYNLKMHQMTHSDEYNYECEICNKHFKNKLQCVRHIRNNHQPKKKETCHICGTVVQCLSLHIRKVHIKSYKCDICNHSFGTLRNLLRHQSTHTDEKPYECDICHKTFKNDGLLFNHRRIHEVEKHVKCEFCDRTFPFPAYLRRHLWKKHQIKSEELTN